MFKYLIFVLTIVAFYKSTAQVDAIEGVDSIVYSKNDAFFEYTILDVFLGLNDSIYLHRLSKEIILRGRQQTQEGGLVKAAVAQIQIDSILEFINRERFAIMKIDDPRLKSDYVTVTTRYYTKGELVNVISDYGADGNQELVKLYNKLDSSVKNIQDWEVWKFNKKIDLINWEQLDSIQIVEHDKSGENYYRNGVKKSKVLMGKDMKKIICYLKKSDQYIPYSKERYSVLTGRTDKYSLIFYTGNEKFIYKYDGRRIMKTSYLHYSTKKNIAKKFL